MRRTALWVAAAAMAACVQPQPPEGPLPPYFLQKALFTADGVWWLNRTVVDLPYQATFTWLGDGDYPDRVRFRIEESWLIAYRDVRIITGNGPDVQGLNDYEAPAAIWPIKRHFDVVNGQIVDSPRKAWWDKQWFEIDWANEATNTMRFSLTNVDTTQRELPAYTIMDPADFDAPIFSADYIDFTTHLTVAAKQSEDPEQQKDDFCSGAVVSSIVDAIDCSPLNIAYRTSLRKIPADHDYEPFYVNRDSPFLDQRWFQRFFRNGRLVIDEQYTLTDNSAQVTLSRFNLWKRSFDDAGNRIPLREREVQIIPMHISVNFPQDVVPILDEALTQWNDVFKSIVQESRAWECVDAGDGDYDACKGSVEVPDTVIGLCPHNPTEEGDPDWCGDPGTVVRLGDQRYFLMQWNDTPSMLQLLGIGWWVPDMVTGEIYSGHIQVWPGDVDRSAATIRDAVLLAQGRIDPDDLVVGEYTSQVTQDLHAFAANPYAAYIDAENPVPMKPPSVDELRTPNDPTVLPTAPDSRPLNGLPAYREAMLAPIIGAPEEVLGIDWESVVLAGMNPDVDPISQEMIERASPFRTPYLQRETLTSVARKRLQDVGADVDFPTDIELATSIEGTQTMSPEEIYEAARTQYLRWIFLHEFGHLLGMRHDFEGSYDTINFPQEYWDLRDDGNMGPRYLDPMTQAERDGNIESFATSSVMDYFNTPLGTPGKLGWYDLQAAHWAYGNLVQVFDRDMSDDAKDVLHHEWGWTFLAPSMTVTIDDPTGVYGHRHTGIHYTTAKERIGDLTQRAWVPVAHMDDRMGWGYPVVDDQGRIGVPNRACHERLADFAPSCLRYDRGADQYEILSSTLNAFDAYYMFASFRRGRTDYRSDRYVDNLRSRLKAPIFDIHSNWIHCTWEYEPEAFVDDEFLGNATRGLDMTFNYLARLIATPEPGDYYLRDFPDGPMLVSSRDFDNHINPDSPAIFHSAFEPNPDTANRVMSLPLGVGRIYRTIDIDDARDRLVAGNVGSAVDKELALEILIEPMYFLFVGQGTWEDPRVWMDGWVRTHRTQMLDLIGSIAAGDMARLAPVWTGTELKYRNFLDPQSTVVGDGTRVNPAIGFNLRIRTLIYGLAFMADNQTDRTFLDLARMDLVDPANPGTLPANGIEFTDQVLTGQTFRAYSYVVDGVEMGIGYRMVQRAQALQTSYLAETDERLLLLGAQALRDQIDLMTIMRALVERFDNHEYDFWKIQDDYLNGTADPNE